MGEASGVDVDNDGDVWVFHRGQQHPIMEFDASTGALKSSFGEGLIVHAHGLEVDHENNVWVTDQRGHQVHKFTPQGDLLMSVGTAGEAGMDATHFDQPTDVVIAPNGDFYVTDGYGNNRVAKFNADGEFLLDWGGRETGDQPGQFELPHGITLGPDGKVYVADRTNLRIQVFTPDGEFIEQWKTDQWARPWGLEYNAADNSIYVMDGGHMRPPDMANVLRMSLDGEVLEKWSSFGTNSGELSWGHDVTVGPDGAVYTVEVRFGLRAQKFVRPPAPTGRRGRRGGR
jgi:DNA-binding beta-propeller fold protein YncE